MKKKKLLFNKVYRKIFNGKVLFKTCRKSIHFLHRFNSIAIDYEIFTEAVNNGIEFLQVFEREDSVYYTATISDFQNNGFNINFGYSEQRALNLKYFKRSRTQEIPAVCRAPSLFEEVSLYDS